jgi:UDPglucose 6-dehydrogenase
MIEKYINDKLNNGISVEVASNPEFLAQGSAVKDTLYASRIVIGVNSKHAKDLLENLYKNFTNFALCVLDTLLFEKLNKTLQILFFYLKQYNIKN